MCIDVKAPLLTSITGPMPRAGQFPMRITLEEASDKNTVESSALAQAWQALAPPRFDSIGRFDVCSRRDTWVCYVAIHASAIAAEGSRLGSDIATGTHRGLVQRCATVNGSRSIVYRYRSRPSPEHGNARIRPQQCSVAAHAIPIANIVDCVQR